MSTKHKFSDKIIDLTEAWMVWMKNNTISHDETRSYEERRKAGEECERMIKLEYQLVEEIDKFFEVDNE